MRKKLIKAGVKNLHQFGYLNTDEENILTDDVYKLFFIQMLKDNLGLTEQIDYEINKLLEELK